LGNYLKVEIGLILLIFWEKISKVLMSQNWKKIETWSPPTPPPPRGKSHNCKTVKMTPTAAAEFRVLFSFEGHVLVRDLWQNPFQPQSYLSFALGGCGSGMTMTLLSPLSSLSSWCGFSSSCLWIKLRSWCVWFWNWSVQQQQLLLLLLPTFFFQELYLSQ
jgi:hypothetical protein